MKLELRWRREGATRHWVRSGALAEPPGEVLDWMRGRGVYLIASRAVLDLHLPRLEALESAAASWEVLTIPDGEAAKTVATAEELWRRLSDEAAGREVRIVALGGGATTDLAGFVANTYLRGVEFGLIPTTTLAQVDAAVGAKSGVNLAGVKNVVGVLAPPTWVIADPQVLGSEGARQRRAGLVEVVKLGCAFDRDLLERVEQSWPALAAGEPAGLEAVIAHAVAAKIEVVKRDPEESGLRRVLNFGHTLGHALEALDRGGGLLHGEAVAYGILFTLRLSRLRAGLSDDHSGRMLDLLRRLDLPPLPEFSPAEALSAMRRDKKMTSEGLVWVLVEGPGRHRFDSGLDPEWVEVQLRGFLHDPWMEAEATPAGEGGRA